jgi:hypothetical protein
LNLNAQVTNIFLVSSTLKNTALSGISNDLTTNDNFDSLEDLNKEIEKLCPFNSASSLLPHQLKLANSRFCDIFSRQSMESDENSSPDDERIDFLATIPNGEVLQLVPKKATVLSSEFSATYQPCTNTIIQLKQSSFSAFRDMTNLKQPLEEDTKCFVGEGVVDEACAFGDAATSHDQQ